ncbi:MAG: glutathione S-transferase family protein [Gammaproteobacteria bacterium]|nr:MAG: glutathione S-transferase family protein [Gammaproteobacteria bacterium]
MKLLGAVASPYVTRTLMFARIKGVDLPLEDVPTGSPRSPEYRALTPIGKIPSLMVGDKVLAESEVICEYLEDTHPEPSGFPADPMGRATSRLISRITDLYIAPHTSTLFRQMNPANRDQTVIDAAAEEFAAAFGYLEHFMGSGPFCVGDTPSLGDCALAPYMKLLKKVVFPFFDDIPDPTEGEGRLAEWWQAIQSHEICKATVDEYGEAVDGFMKGMGARITGQQPKE